MVFKENFVAVIKHNGKIMRELDGRVILPFNSEYSILMKNKEGRKAVVNVEIDGQDVLDHRNLIIGTNSDFELYGFMRGCEVKNRFKFIQKTKEISDHRGDHVDDGIIRIGFRFEKKIEEIIHHDHWHYYPPIWPYLPKRPIVYRQIGCGADSLSIGSSTCDSNQQSVHSNHAFSLSNTPSGSPSNGPSFSVSNTPLPGEGITVKGSETYQNFVAGSHRELESQENVITIVLKGINTKGVVDEPVTVQTKFQCPTCGRFSKSFMKFCPNCGTCLI